MLFNTVINTTINKSLDICVYTYIYIYREREREMLSNS